MSARVHESRGGDGVDVESGGVISVKNGGRIDEEAGGAILGRAVLNAYHADIGTAGSTYVVCPFDGDIVQLEAVNIAANAGVKSVLTAKVAGATVTHPAWEVAVTAVAGTRSGVTPTAATAVLAGQVIEIASDGGSSAVTPATYSIVVRRKS